MKIPENNPKSRIKFLKGEIKKRGWTLTEVSKRWQIKPKRMSQILKDPSRMELDSIYGLPDISNLI